LPPDGAKIPEFEYADAKSLFASHEDGLNDTEIVRALVTHENI
jgi:hypothetical protein